ncbi:MAG: cobalamin-binding protein [Betaproteobacteria bacterium]|nr:cobalamin-binding protein [Betaproteobacteria bacterium]
MTNALTTDHLVDALGTRHDRAEGEVRIVSLVPSITELICALGLGVQLVGRTGFCIHPRTTVHSIPKVGGTKDVDLKKIRALKPTHVIVNVDENRREVADALRTFVPHLIVTHPTKPEDNISLYRLLGAIFDQADAAERLANEFSTALKDCRKAAQGFATEVVLYLIWRDPWMTVSHDTYVAQTLALVGWQALPVASSLRYPTLELDESTIAQAERILLSSEPYRFTKHHVAELSQHPAVHGKPVALIDGEMTSWYGNRAIEGLRYLTRYRRDQTAT